MALAVAALLWAVGSGQYDDLDEARRTVLEPDGALHPSRASERQPVPEAGSTPRREAR
jgi:cbb3-type cytochrome oxidase maturation protein